ncbi:hypothetical protein SVAN01_09191 [Stagonosporopsis vannaccii]|nr:hypothetical protein SVAN01_09191 [Stagonosporopsis vannaccii]
MTATSRAVIQARVVVTGMRVVQDRGERYVSDVDGSKEGHGSVEASVRRQVPGTDDGDAAPSLSTRQARRRFPAPIVTGKQRSAAAAAAPASRRSPPPD